MGNLAGGARCTAVLAASPVTAGAHLAVVALAWLACTGCAGAPAATSYSVAIDPGFTNDQADEVSAALGVWQAAVSGLRIDTKVASCGPGSSGVVCVRPSHEPTDPSDDVVGQTTPGAGNGATLVLIYVDRIGAMGQDVAPLTQQTAAHEMGHAMGLRHSSPGELMAPLVTEQAHTVTAADVAQFWAVRGE